MGLVAWEGSCIVSHKEVPGSRIVDTHWIAWSVLLGRCTFTERNDIESECTYNWPRADFCALDFC